MGLDAIYPVAAEILPPFHAGDGRVKRISVTVATISEKKQQAGNRIHRRDNGWTPERSAKNSSSVGWTYEERLPDRLTVRPGGDPVAAGA